MLPKIKSPMFDVVIPSTKKPIKVRQFTVKEEKILLTATQSNEIQDFFNALLQVVNNCLLDTKINVKKLPLFDIEYIFTKIRSVSVSNISKVSYKDSEDEQLYDFEIKLDELEVKFPENISNKFKIDDNYSFTMKYPPMEIYTTKEFFNLQEDGIFEVLSSKCLDEIFDGDKVYNAVDESDAERKEFINSLPAKTYEQIRTFLSNLPSMKHELSYTNKNGKKVDITLRTINDFFTFG